MLLQAYTDFRWDPPFRSQRGWRCDIACWSVQSQYSLVRVEWEPECSFQRWAGKLKFSDFLHGVMAAKSHQLTVHVWKGREFISRWYINMSREAIAGLPKDCLFLCGGKWQLTRIGEQVVVLILLKWCSVLIRNERERCLTLFGDPNPFKGCCPQEAAVVNQRLLVNFCFSTVLNIVC